RLGWYAPLSKAITVPPCTCGEKPLRQLTPIPFARSEETIPKTRESPSGLLTLSVIGPTAAPMPRIPGQHGVVVQVGGPHSSGKQFAILLFMVPSTNVDWARAAGKIPKTGVGVPVTTSSMRSS